MTPVGGTGGAVALWAGLIALLDQGTGRPLGYLNPILYSQIGPAGVFHTADDARSGSEAARPAATWQPFTGWGSPDGARLLDWLRTHQVLNQQSASNQPACGTG